MVFGPLGLEFPGGIFPDFDLDRGDRRDGRSHAASFLDAGCSLSQALADGVLWATVANHSAAGFIGARLGRFLTPARLDLAVGISMIGMALWTLKPDSLNEDSSRLERRGAFVATVVTFFIAEIGDKTQIATVALAAAYPSLLAVVAGTTTGMLLANAPVVFLGKAFSERLTLKIIHYVRPRCSRSWAWFSSFALCVIRSSGPLQDLGGLLNR